jgi:hypothetical protein
MSEKKSASWENAFILRDVIDRPEFYRSSGLDNSLIDPSLIFALANKSLPNVRMIRNLMKNQDLIGKFCGRFSIEPWNVVTTSVYRNEKKSFCDKNGFAVIHRNLMVEFDSEMMEPAVNIFYGSGTDMVLLSKVCDFLLEFRQAEDKPKIGLLTIDGPYGTQLTNIDLDPSEIDMDTYFNDDLKPVHEIIVARLSEPKGKGIVLLHGAPGTGKTTYLRYLASVLKKQLIFVPFEVAGRIASPDFIAFMLDHKESILILEDAEHILKERLSDENLSVANLLNLSDGLLSDCLHMQLICTFNTDVAHIDKALLRKGRIIARYEFRKLPVEKCSAIAEKLGNTRKIDRPMTLAEIFHLEDGDYSVNKRQAIGF